MTKHWAVQDAKAKFSELLRAAEKEPQHITVRGEEAAVVISETEYRRLTQPPRKGGKPTLTLLEALRACPYELEIPEREPERDRDIGL